MIIAIDGPAASGKGTLGKRLAKHYGYRHLDTGVIYRAVAKALLDARADLNNEMIAVSAALELDPEKFGDPALKTQAVGDAASVVSAFPKVREVLLNFQRQFAADPPGAVLDGRDIGTVICPHADVKIFVVADPRVRARRRTLEARARGENADEAAVLADILIRDERDRNRAVAPLKPAADAYLLDNSHLDIEGGVRAAIDIVEAVRAGRQKDCASAVIGGKPATGFEIDTLKVPDKINVPNVEGKLPARSRGFCEAVVRVCGSLTLPVRCAL